MSNRFDYRLQIWDGKKYIQTYVYSDGTRDQHNDAIRALWRDPEYKDKPMAYRIVQTSKERPLKPRTPRLTTSTRITMADSIGYRAQAQAAAEHYQRLRVRDLEDHFEAGILTSIPVFPVKPSGRGMAADFRLELARILTGQLPFTRGAFWGKSERETREILEARLGEAGYQFVEVDLEDYPS